MKQIDLFDVFEQQQVTAKARNSDPVTSHIAADQMTKTGKAEQDRKDIMRIVAAKPGLTAGEIARELGDGWNNVRVSRRSGELKIGVTFGKSRRCAVNGNYMVTWYAKS